MSAKSPFQKLATKQPWLISNIIISVTLQRVGGMNFLKWAGLIIFIVPWLAICTHTHTHSELGMAMYMYMYLATVVQRARVREAM